MQLTPQEVELFYKLHKPLLLFVHQRLGILEKTYATLDEFSHVSPEERMQLREELDKDRALIDAFVSDNPFALSDEELEIARSWKHMVSGQMYIFRQLQKHMVFLDTQTAPTAYGVLALADAFDVICPFVPVLGKAVLLPFQGRIVYDGLLSVYNVSFGPGIRRGLTERYREAKQRGIVTALPADASPGSSFEGAMKMKTRKATKRREPSLVGRWSIESMDAYELFDDDEPAYVEFGPKGIGSLAFACVQGEMDYELTQRDGLPAAEFSWEGNDDSDSVSGRGWAVLDGKDLRGEIHIHMGDRSSFRAVKSRQRAVAR